LENDELVLENRKRGANSMMGEIQMWKKTGKFNDGRGHSIESNAELHHRCQRDNKTSKS
jgi:hypothetical protein